MSNLVLGIEASLRKINEVKTKLFNISDAIEDLSLENPSEFVQAIDNVIRLLDLDLDIKSKRKEECLKKGTKIKDKNIKNLQIPSNSIVSDQCIINLPNKIDDELQIWNFLKYSALVHDKNSNQVIDILFAEIATTKRLTISGLVKALKNSPFFVSNQEIAKKMAKLIILTATATSSLVHVQTSKNTLITNVLNALGNFQAFSIEESATLQEKIEKKFKSVSQDIFVQKFFQLSKKTGLIGLLEFFDILNNLHICENQVELDFVVVQAIKKKQILSSEKSIFLFDPHMLIQLFEMPGTQPSDSVIAPLQLEKKISTNKVVQDSVSLSMLSSGTLKCNHPYLQSIQQAQKIFQKNLEEFQQKKTFFKDIEFKTHLGSLCEENTNKPLGKNLKWFPMRTDAQKKEHKLFDNINPHAIMQGRLGNCYLVAALICISSRPDIITKLFENKEKNDCSYYGVWLHESGMRKLIEIDDVLPYTCEDVTPKSEDPSKKVVGPQKIKRIPIFSYSKQKEIWPQLIEKACAKVFGGYPSLRGGNCAESFNTLLGCPTELIRIEKETPESLWAKVVEFNRRGYFLACDTFKKFECKALPANHAFSILKVIEKDKILILRNPWGRNEFKADDLPPEYQGEIADDKGAFYITWSKFCVYFFDIIVARFQDTEYNYSCVTCLEVPFNIIQLKVMANTNAFLTFHQLSKRKSLENVPSKLRILVYEGNKEGEPIQLINGIFQGTEMCGTECNFQKGYYFIIAEGLWEKDSQMPLNLSVYSEKPISFKEISNKVTIPPDELIKKIFLKDFEKNPESFKIIKPKVPENIPITGEVIKAMKQTYGFLVYVFQNKSNKIFIEEGQNTALNLQICLPFNDTCKHEISLQPQETCVVLYKAINDPLKRTPYQYSHKMVCKSKFVIQ